MCGNGIQKMAIVGDHYNEVFEIDQEIFQPVDSLGIKVVSRFIQNKDIRIAKKCLGQ